MMTVKINDDLEICDSGYDDDDMEICKSVNDDDGDNTEKIFEWRGDNDEIDRVLDLFE